jgi:hypothetical protein
MKRSVHAASRPPLAALGLTLLLGSAPALAQEASSATAPSPPAWRRPGAGDRRFTVQLGLGPAGDQAPWVLLGVAAGVAVGPWRLDLAGRMGRVRAGTAWPVDPAWNDGFNTYTAARTETQTLLLELSLARRVGALEAWGAAGLHATQLQLAAEYDALRCTDLLCLGPKVPVHDTDWHDGRFVTRPALGAGVRLPVLDWALLGLEARWLSKGRSEVSRFGVARDVGGLAVAASLAVRFGARRIPVRE